MGDRYWITGVQLGMMIAFIAKEDWKEMNKLVSKIQEEQMIETSLERFKKGMKEMRDANR